MCIMYNSKLGYSTLCTYTVKLAITEFYCITIKE